MLDDKTNLSIAARSSPQLESASLLLLHRRLFRFMVQRLCSIHPCYGLDRRRTGLEVRVFGGLKGDPLSHTSKWRIPPSPPEVSTFEVEKIPLIIIFDLDGVEIGRIIEFPKQFPTLEQEICEIIRRQ